MQLSPGLEDFLMTNSDCWNFPFVIFRMAFHIYFSKNFASCGLVQ
jgi:hypothetical protein